jgi:hypothetical protein
VNIEDGFTLKMKMISKPKDLGQVSFEDKQSGDAHQSSLSSKLQDNM